MSRFTNKQSPLQFLAQLREPLLVDPSGFFLIQLLFLDAVRDGVAMPDRRDDVQHEREGGDAP